MSDTDEKNKLSVRRGRQRVRAQVTWDDNVDKTLTTEFGDIERPLTAVQCPTADGSISIRITGIDDQAIMVEEYARQGRVSVPLVGTLDVLKALIPAVGKIDSSVNSSPSCRRRPASTPFQGCNSARRGWRVCTRHDGVARPVGRCFRRLV